MFSAIENSSTRPRRCRSSGMCPTPASSIFRAVACEITRPPTTTSPLSARLRPVIASISSLWPLPSTPARATISPARTLKDTSRTAGRSRSSLTSRLRTSSSVSPVCAGGFSTRSSTSRPTIMRASPSSVAPSRGTVSILFPRRRDRRSCRRGGQRPERADRGDHRPEAGRQRRRGCRRPRDLTRHSSEDAETPRAWDASPRTGSAAAWCSNSRSRRTSRFMTTTRLRPRALAGSSRAASWSGPAG